MTKRKYEFVRERSLPESVVQALRQIQNVERAWGVRAMNRKIKRLLRRNEIIMMRSKPRKQLTEWNRFVMRNAGDNKYYTNGALDFRKLARAYHGENIEEIKEVKKRKPKRSTEKEQPESQQQSRSTSPEPQIPEPLEEQVEIEMDEEREERPQEEIITEAVPIPQTNKNLKIRKNPKRRKRINRNEPTKTRSGRVVKKVKKV